MTCSNCGRDVNEGARFCSSCGGAVVGGPFVPVQSRLVRPRQERMIAGVCAGFAQHFGWDVAVVRLVVCLGLLIGCGTLGFAYLVAWIVMPNGPYLFPMQGYAPPPQNGAPSASQTGVTGS